MAQASVTITSPMGLHARPAGLIARLAAASDFQISIGKTGSEPVDAASILSIMGLGLSQGDEVLITSPDAAAQTLLDEMATAIQSDGADS